MNEGPALAVRGLSVTLATRAGLLTAVDGVSFDIAAGEVLGLVGESGAGKSLTGAAIIGLVEPPLAARGEVRLNGRRIDNLSRAAWQSVRGRGIGAIFQDPLTALDPLFSIGDQLCETLRAHFPLSRAEAQRRAIALLADVGIGAPAERFHQFPHQFSGGMRQRVVIAVALAAEPALIIADEPTTALDVSIQAQIIALLGRIARERRTAILLITHDMGVIASIADRVCVMYAGRIVESGAVGDIIHRPRHPYTAGLMGAIPSMTGSTRRLAQVDGTMPRLDAIPHGCAFHPRCAEADARCGEQRPPFFSMQGGEAACWRRSPG